MNFEELNEKKELASFFKNVEWIPEENKEIYLKKYTFYRDLFTKFIIEKANLQEYDLKIKNSEYDFKPNEKDDLDFYQYFSSDVLSFFYIRNNIYIERLDEAENNEMQELMEKHQEELNDETRKFIEKTYKKIVVEEISNDEEKKMSFYGPNTTSFMAPSDSLVIGMRYDEFAEDNLTDEKWKERCRNQRITLYKIFDELEAKLSDKLEITVQIIKYNDYSVESFKSKNK